MGAHRGRVLFDQCQIEFETAVRIHRQSVIREEVTRRRIALVDIVAV